MKCVHAVDEVMWIQGLQQGECAEREVVSGERDHSESVYEDKAGNSTNDSLQTFLLEHV